MGIFLKTKDRVFDCLLHWKAFVERKSKQKFKALRIDNAMEENIFQTSLRSISKTKESDM